MTGWSTSPGCFLVNLHSFESIADVRRDGGRHRSTFLSRAHRFGVRRTVGRGNLPTDVPVNIRSTKGKCGDQVMYRSGGIFGSEWESGSGGLTLLEVAG